MQIRDLDLAEQLLLHELRFGPRPGDVSVDYACLPEIAARRLLIHHAPGDPGEPWPDIVVVGGGAMAEALVTQLAQMRVVGKAEQPPKVTVLDPTSDALVGRLKGRHDRVSVVLDLHTDGNSPVTAQSCLALMDAGGSAVYIAMEEEDRALALALALQLADPSPAKIVVQTLRGQTLLEATTGLAQGSTTVEHVGIIDQVADPDTLLGGFIEELARAIHSNYVAVELAKRSRGEECAPERSLAPWSNLDSELRAQNRDQAANYVNLLSSIGACATGSLTEADEPFSFTPAEVEFLAEKEHQRWEEQKRRSGWTLGDLDGKQDVARKKHPDMKPYSELSLESKNKDRKAVLEIPVLLASLNFDVMRLAKPRQQLDDAS
jgi:hypothetical protein